MANEWQQQQQETQQPSPLWLTSRSAFERGTQYCPFARYIEYHSGPYGYGIQRRAQSVPLTTGTYSHQGITDTLLWILDAKRRTGKQPATAPDEVIRWAAGNAVAKYKEVVEKRGILTLTQDDPESLAKLQILIQEQAFLIEGLTWAWCLLRLPWYLSEYELLHVEQEEEYVLECSCGLGDGVGGIQDHEARGCSGIGLLSRPDLLGRRWSDGAVAYTEFKTASVTKREWNDSWERKQQFLIGILGAESRLGEEISHAWVEGLVKGQRKRDYPYTSDLPKKQASVFCYGYFRGGGVNPAGLPAEWRPGYTYTDAEGLKHTCDKKGGWRKSALWEMPAEVAFPDLPEGQTVVEFWAKKMLELYPYDLRNTLNPIGPIPKQRHQIEKAMRSIAAEERLWQDRLWRIYEFSEANSGVAWGDDGFMEAVEKIVPRSWNCDPYGPDHPCPHQVICHPVTEEWRQPVETGLYVYRAPHHEAEKEQMEARGLKPEVGYAEELDEGEED